MGGGDFLFWFTIRVLNSWIFRLNTILFALLVFSTVLYTFIEFYKTIRPGRRLEKLSTQLFCYWAILLQALLFIMGIGYIFPD